MRGYPSRRGSFNAIYLSHYQPTTSPTRNRGERRPPYSALVNCSCFNTHQGTPYYSFSKDSSPHCNINFSIGSPSLTAVQLHASSDTVFQGACLDIGAQRSCIGHAQARALSMLTKILLQLTKSQLTFRFGDQHFSSLGKMQIRIPTPEDTFLYFYVDVVPPNVPLLLGIDVLDCFQFVADNVRNVLENRKQGWTLPIQRKHGHLYLYWDASEVLFTASELKKLHGHFTTHPLLNSMHCSERPTPTKLLARLSRHFRKFKKHVVRALFTLRDHIVSELRCLTKRWYLIMNWPWISFG